MGQLVITSLPTGSCRMAILLNPDESVDSYPKEIIVEAADVDLLKLLLEPFPSKRIDAGRSLWKLVRCLATNINF